MLISTVHISIQPEKLREGKREGKKEEANERRKEEGGRKKVGKLGGREEITERGRKIGR